MHVAARRVTDALRSIKGIPTAARELIFAAVGYYVIYQRSYVAATVPQQNSGRHLPRSCQKAAVVPTDEWLVRFINVVTI